MHSASPTGTVADVEWHGEPAVQVTGGGGLTAVVVPGRGAKIASLVDAGGHEWLAQPALPLEPPARGPVSFVDAEMCGWDECVPTVDASELDGRALPDHGEVWSRPWAPQGEGRWGCTGDVLRYELSRAVVPTDAGLRLDYEVHALEDLPFLWAAHPQLVVGPGARVVLPADVHEVIGIHGVVGRHIWDEELAAVDSVAHGRSQKLWVDPQTPVGWAEVHRADGVVLRMAWDADVAPYLAIWTDAADFSREPVLALEPATAGTETPARALAEGTCRVLAAGEHLHWSVTLDVRQ